MTGYVNILISMKVLIVMGFYLLYNYVFFYNIQIIKFWYDKYSNEIISITTKEEVMSAIIIDGESFAGKIRTGLIEEINTLKKKGFYPHLKAVQVGENAASRLYVQNQQKQCETIGIKYTLDELSADIKEAALVEHINKLNNDPQVTGIILQMPLPEGIDAKKVQTLIAPHKDVEGMNPANMGELVYGNTRLVPCTAMAAVELVKSVSVEIRGKETTIVGRGAIVIDVGINRVKELDAQGNPILNVNGKPKMKTVGDVEFATAKEVASYITPVPGGVGPVTVVMLLRNTVEALKISVNL